MNLTYLILIFILQIYANAMFFIQLMKGFLYER